MRLSSSLSDPQANDGKLTVSLPYLDVGQYGQVGVTFDHCFAYSGGAITANRNVAFQVLPLLYAICIFTLCAMAMTL